VIGSAAARNGLAATRHAGHVAMMELRRLSLRKQRLRLPSQPIATT
jgi:hypothetical protein